MPIWQETANRYLRQSGGIPDLPEPDESLWTKAQRGLSSFLEGPLGGLAEVPLTVVSAPQRAVETAVGALRGGIQLAPEEREAYGREAFERDAAVPTPGYEPENPAETLYRRLRGKGYTTPGGGQIWREALAGTAELAGLPKVSQVLGVSPVAPSEENPGGFRGMTPEEQAQFEQESPVLSRLAPIPRVGVEIGGSLLTDPTFMAGGLARQALSRAKAGVTGLSDVAKLQAAAREAALADKVSSAAFLPGAVAGAGIAGLEAGRAISEEGFTSPRAIEAALQAGVSGFLAKGAAKGAFHELPKVPTEPFNAKRPVAPEIVPAEVKPVSIEAPIPQPVQESPITAKPEIPVPALVSAIEPPKPALEPPTPLTPETPLAPKPSPEPVPTPELSFLKPELVSKAFPTGKIAESEGGYLVDLPGNRQIRVSPIGEIEYNPEAFAAGYSRPKGEGERIVGSWQKLDRGGLIQLAKEGPVEPTLLHESFHAAMDLALSDKEKAAVLKRYGNEEAAADAYAQWNPKAQTNSWFSRILGFFKNIYRSFRPSWESTFERTRSGEAYGKAEPTIAPDQPRYATAPAEPIGEAPLTPEAESVMAEGGDVEGKPPEKRFNYGNLDLPDEMKQRLDRFAEVSVPVEQRGKVSFEEFEAEARSLGLPRDVIAQRMGDKARVPTKEELFLARNVLVDDQKRLSEVAERVKAAQAAVTANESGAHDKLQDAQLELLKVSAEADSFMKMFAGRQTEAARTLAFFRIMAKGLTPEDRQMLRMGKKVGGLLTPDEVASVVNAPPEGRLEAARKLITGTRMKRVTDAAFEMWLNGLLSGPPTHFANAASNGLFQVLRGVERGVGGGIDALFSRGGKEKERFVGEAAAHFSGMREGLGDAFKSFRAALGETADSGRLEDQPGAIPGKAGKIIRAPTRLLQASDEFFKTLARYNEKYAMAYRMASQKANGKTRAELLDEYRRLAALPDDQLPPEMRSAMEASAVEQTFQRKTGQTLAMLLATRDKVPTLRWVVPFVRTPWNIAVEGVKRTPIRVAQLLLKAGSMPRSEWTDEMAKAITGSMIMLGVGAMAKEGIISGGGPTDPREKANKIRTGWQPYSIRTPDGSWISYQRLEPISSILGMAADLVETGDRGQNAPTKLVDTIAQNVTSKTFLTGLESLFSYWNDPARYGPQFFGGYIRSALPFSSLLRKTAEATDTTQREVEPMKLSEPSTWLGQMQAGIPGLRQRLEPKRAPSGDVQEFEDTAPERFLSPFRRREERPERYLEREFGRLGWVPDEPSRQSTVKGVKVELTDEEYRLLQKARMRASDEARRLIRSYRYQDMTDDQREYALRRVYDKYGTKARGRIRGAIQARAKQQQAST